MKRLTKTHPNSITTTTTTSPNTPSPSSSDIPLLTELISLFRPLYTRFYLSLSLSFLVRLGLIFYSVWQDNHFEVKYTDVDYFVFQEAAQYVMKGLSPYLRSTYRYTPLLSYFLCLDLYFQLPWLGKLGFSVMDLVVALYLKKMNISEKWILVTWVWNPFVMTISTRGNAEAFLCGLCIMMVYHFHQAFQLSPPSSSSSSSSTMNSAPLGSNRLVEESNQCSFVWFRFSQGQLHFVWSAMLFGFSVHMKLYPIIYVFPLTFFIFRSYSNPIVSFFWFGCISFFIFVSFTSGFYYIYGMEYLNESLLYHFYRLDHRHNFSVYAYMLSFTSPSSSSSSLLHEMSDSYFQRLLFSPFIPFVSQWMGVIGLGYFFPSKSLMLAMFTQTMYFVAVNKVMTSQYFMWFLCFLPSVIAYGFNPSTSFTSSSSSTLRPRVIGSLILSWLGAQALWLHFAYQLEFQAKNTFVELFSASILLFATHIAILYVLLSQHQDTKSKSKSSSSSLSLSLKT